MQPSSWKRVAIGSIGISAALAIFVAAGSRAAGIPDADVLTYSGYLEGADGAPLTGKHSIAVSLWESAEATSDLCTRSMSGVELKSGRFQVPLPGECTDAIKANPNLFIDVLVDGASLGRTKLGAVPFAVEAGHATSADAATAGGELDARVTAIENGLPGKSAFYAYTSTSTQMLASGTYAPIAFDTKKYDLGGEFASGVFKAATAGYYFFSCNAGLGVGTPGTTAYFEAILMVNGVNWGATSGQGDLFNASRNVQQLIKLAKGDTVNCTAFQTTGASRPVTGTFVGFRTSL